MSTLILMKKQERVILFYAMLTTNDAAALMGNIIYAMCHVFVLLFVRASNVWFGLHNFG